METNEVLVLLLIAPAVIIVVLKNRVDRLSQDMHGQATALLSALSTRERQIRDGVKAGRVRWDELRVPSEPAV
jgi:predicted Holliday junction resolvase-like endonuclease